MCSTVALLPGTARAQADAAGDAAATRHLVTARREFLSGRGPSAARSLEQALDACAIAPCSTSARSKILLELGLVKAGALGDAAGAKRAFALALAADPAARLPADVTTPEVAKAFLDALGEANQARGAHVTSPPPVLDGASTVETTQPVSASAARPQPIAAVGTATWTARIGLVGSEQASEAIPERSDRLSSPLALPPLARLDATALSLTVSYARSLLREPSKQASCADQATEGGSFAFEREWHAGGSLVGHRWFGDAAYESASGIRCSRMTALAMGTARSGYGLDFHLPLPGLAARVSVGPFLAGRTEFFQATTPVDPAVLGIHGASQKEEIASNLLLEYGAHARWQLGSPDRALFGRIDGSVARREYGSVAGAYGTAVATLGYRWFSVEGTYQSRLDSADPARAYRTVSEAFAGAPSTRTATRLGVSFNL